MSNLLFDNVRQWRVCFWAGVCKAAWGLWRIFTCIVFGVISVLAHIGRQIGAFFRREFVASLIIGALIALICGGWIFTFVTERAARVGAEMQRDSLVLRLDSAKRNSGHLKFDVYQNHWTEDGDK